MVVCTRDLIKVIIAHFRLKKLDKKYDSRFHLVMLLTKLKVRKDA